MRVPLNDTKRQYQLLKDEIEQAIQRVLNSGRYVLGPEVEAFEEEFAAYCGCAHSIAVGNATDALEIALRAYGCRPGDEVIMAANAGMYAATACVQIGATPVFADIEEATLQISAESVAALVSAQTRAVVVTHLYGKLADVSAVRTALGTGDIGLVEDCAQAHGAQQDERRAGSFGDMGTFSFYPTKNLGALGDGGAIVTDQVELAGRIRKLHQYGWTERFHAEIPLGRNSRMDELQAACLRVKLPRLDAWNQRRRDIVKRYRVACKSSRFRVVHEPAADYVAHLCVVRHPERDKARQALEEAGVATAIHFPVPDHQQLALQLLDWRSSRLDVTEQMQNEILTLPCHAEMTEEEIDHVCAALKQCG